MSHIDFKISSDGENSLQLALWGPEGGVFRNSWGQLNCNPWLSWAQTTEGSRVGPVLSALESPTLYLSSLRANLSNELLLIPLSREPAAQTNSNHGSASVREVSIHLYTATNPGTLVVLLSVSQRSGVEGKGLNQSGPSGFDTSPSFLFFLWLHFSYCHSKYTTPYNPLGTRCLQQVWTSWREVPTQQSKWTLTETTIPLAHLNWSGSSGKAAQSILMSMKSGLIST